MGDAYDVDLLGVGVGVLFGVGCEEDVAYLDEVEGQFVGEQYGVVAEEVLEVGDDHEEHLRSDKLIPSARLCRRPGRRLPSAFPR